MKFFSGQVEEFRQVVPVTINFTLDDVSPFLSRTAESVLLRFLGQTLADQLASLVNANLDEQTDRVLIRALKLTRLAVGNIGFAEYLPFGEVQIEDGAITVAASEGRKPAFQYQTDRLEEKLLQTGYQALDDLITLVAANSVLFPGWSEAPYKDEYDSSFFKSPVEFSKSYGIQDRWLTFWALRPALRSVEENYGEAAQARIDALPNTVTDAQKAQLGRLLRRALAYQTILEALPGLAIDIDGAKLKVNYGSQFGNTQYYQAPSRDDLNWLQQNLEKQTALFWSTFESTLSAALPPVSETATATGPQSEGSFFLL
ncbi:hypothetical protein G8759_31335 [Spirosoma aureum]|uniref:Uncharacterized protein n=1 Tax=Spirosoma aureum TaxID=2692134 RepID=A0A6G9AWU2_9BACT|nr:DUF6712 family protein [Spirosoma aureum]QIP16818.1 hypothetical protein G8759_31335 [Spirosoma aureum]